MIVRHGSEKQHMELLEDGKACRMHNDDGWTVYHELASSSPFPGVKAAMGELPPEVLGLPDRFGRSVEDVLDRKVGLKDRLEVSEFEGV